MLNGILVFIVLVSILLAAATGQMQALTDGLLTDARRAVEIAIELVGVMAFFLGLMKVAEEGGLLRLICRLAAPLMRRLFPAVPPDHPAMGAMVLNIASNLMGLGNAATPFGIRAMQELDRLNGRRGTATNAMVLFLAINTAGLAILPATTIALRAAAGSANATGILVPTWIASGPTISATTPATPRCDASVATRDGISIAIPSGGARAKHIMGALGSRDKLIVRAAPPRGAAKLPHGLRDSRAERAGFQPPARRLLGGFAGRRCVRGVGSTRRPRWEM